MTSMTPARHTKARTPGLGAAWAVLIGTGITSVTYNVVHATQGARLEVVLALLLGFAPAFVAACLSHVAAVLDAPSWVKAAVIAVMGAGMVLSASATAAVVAPADPGWRGWLFGCTLDAAALLALWAILTARGRKNEAAMAVDAAHAEAALARTAVLDAREQAAAAEGAQARIAEELASVRAELEAERLRASARKPKRRSARKPARTSARNLMPASAPEPDVVPAAASAPEDTLGLDAEALILQYLDQGYSASAAGIKAGKSDSYGRQVARLAKAAQKEPAGTERVEGDMS